ncbi:MAG: AAA family ATPase, partial [Bdellovibrionales bacterium]|nr:AAA family ATPase [Bdellovibrionales bacterium]
MPKNLIGFKLKRTSGYKKRSDVYGHMFRNQFTVFDGAENLPSLEGADLDLEGESLTPVAHDASQIFFTNRFRAFGNGVTLDPGPFEPQQIAMQLHRLALHLEAQVVNREALIHQTLLALMTGGNMLIESPPGMAKSLLVDNIAIALCGASTFSTELSREDRSRVLIGGERFEDTKAGKVRIETKGTILDADIALVDELFRGNDSTLNRILKLLNEGYISHAGVRYQGRLHLFVGTTNDVRRTPENAAFLDRMEYRCRITNGASISDALERDLAYSQHHGRPVAPPQEARISILHLKEMAEYLETPAVQIPLEVLFLKNLLIERWAGTPTVGQHTSDRTSVHSSRILRASAVLAGRTQVIPEDLLTLQYVIPVVGTP